jgi:hypothetical protein
MDDLVIFESYNALLAGRMTDRLERVTRVRETREQQEGS